MGKGITLHKGDSIRLYYAPLVARANLTGGLAEISAVTQYSESGGEADTRDVTGLGGKTARATGTPGVPQITVSMLYAPGAQASRDLAKYRSDRSTVRFELHHIEEVVEADANIRAAITAAGAVTFSKQGGTSPSLPTEHPDDFGIGMALKFGSGDSAKYYDIEEVPDAATADGTGFKVAVRIATSGALVSAAAATVVIPGLKRVVSARVGVAGGVEVGSDSDMTSTLTLNPLGPLSDFALIQGSWAALATS